MKSLYAKGEKGKGKACLLTILLLVSTIVFIIPSVQAAPHPIYGYAEKDGGGSTDGALVEVENEDGIILNTTVGPEGGWNSGYWQVDVGDNPTTDRWSEGTNFTVTITLDSWVGTNNSGIVSGNYTEVADITLYDTSGDDDDDDSGGGGGGTPAPSNNPPTADPNGPYTGYENNIIVFDGTGSTDEDGSITSYSWSFGDGSTSDDATPTHLYNTAGNYTVSLTVEDEDGATDTQSTYAIISAEPEGEAPTAEITAPAQSIVNQAITFSAEESTDTDGTITNYTWTFDDGTIGYGETITHTYSVADTYVVTLTVIDNDRKTDSTQHIITISEAEPIDIPDGYVVDSDNDGEPDDFYNAETGQTSKMQKQDDGTYLIDTDNDGIWDKIYDPASGTVTTYEPTEEEPDEGFPLWGIAIIIIVIILIVIGLLFYTGILYIEHEE